MNLFSRIYGRYGQSSDPGTGDLTTPTQLPGAPVLAGSSTTGMPRLPTAAPAPSYTQTLQDEQQRLQGQYQQRYGQTYGQQSAASDPYTTALQLHLQQLQNGMNRRPMLAGGIPGIARQS